MSVRLSWESPASCAASDHRVRRRGQPALRQRAGHRRARPSSAALSRTGARIDRHIRRPRNDHRHRRAAPGEHDDKPCSLDDGRRQPLQRRRHRAPALPLRRRDGARWSPPPREVPRRETRRARPAGDGPACSVSRASACSRSIAPLTSGGRTDSARVAPSTTSRSGAVRPERAAAADKRHPGRALEPFATGHGNDADDAGARHVRAAARRQIEIRDLDQPQRARRGPAPCAAAARPPPRRSRTARVTGPVLPDDAIRLGLGRGRSPPRVTSRARSIVEASAPR